MRVSQVLVVCIILTLSSMMSGSVQGRPEFEPVRPEATVEKSGIIPMLSDDDLRIYGVHDAGDVVVDVWHAHINGSGYFMEGVIDPESGETAPSNSYPRGSGNMYMYNSGLWVGGVADTDTLVTTAATGWYMAMEFIPEDEAAGGLHRSGNFADDEYISVTVDTNPNISSYPYDHIPLGLELTMTTRTWGDSLYDDFILVECVVKNIGTYDIRDGWAGSLMDNDIYHVDQSYYYAGYDDDFSGCLDTLLDDGDPGSRTLIAYSFDDDGDPGRYLSWDDSSVTGAVATMLLDCSFPVERMNFNWWVSHSDPNFDFGPRQVGTPEDPFYDFDEGNLGTPVYDDERYYILSHPEVDYNQLEIMVHDSSDGWVPPQCDDPAQFYFDTKLCLSFGSFDLPPGDSIMIAYALVFAERLHVSGEDFADYWDPLAPDIYQETLDFSPLLIHCRRADSVYRSGYLLPHPGPPAGLHVTAYDDGYINIAWHPSVRSDLAGYRVYVMDKTYGSNWYSVSSIVTDTTFHIPIFEPEHLYDVAVSMIDTQGRESELSRAVSVLPCVPHEPKNLKVVLDGMVPELSWQPGVDTAFVVYIIYRGIGVEDLVMYDSTMAPNYRDYNIESGVQYSYYVSARNAAGYESDVVGPVKALPMALDKGILYCNQNRTGGTLPNMYPPEFTQRLYSSLASLVPMAYINAQDSMPTFSDLTHYSLLIVDESGVFRTLPISLDSLAIYLSGGGKAILMKPALGSVGSNRRVATFGEGSLSHEIFKIDSFVTGGFVSAGGAIIGDLTGVTSVQPEYPSLTTDTTKLSEAYIPIIGYIPSVGYMYPGTEVERIYTYESSNPDTINHGQTTGYRYIGDVYSFIWLTCPLMLMEEPDGFVALKQALVDLGGDVSCGDANMDGLMSVGDALTVIAYLYHGGPEPENFWRADVDCSGEIDLGDAVEIINYIFSRGWLGCCPRY